MMSLVMGLKQPEEIRPGEVLAFWEKLREMTPHGCFSVYRSPNRDLWAWMDAEGSVAHMWSVDTGQVYHADTAALGAFISKLGGWVG